MINVAEGKRWYSVTQKNKVNPTDKMLIYDGSSSYVVPLSLVKGADNLTDDYVLLTGEDGIDYRVKIDVLGNAKVIKNLRRQYKMNLSLYSNYYMYMYYGRICL